MNRQLDQLRQLMAQKAIDLLIISNPVNYRYLSGFKGSAGVLLITPTAQYLMSDFRYYEQASKQAPGYEFSKAPLGTENGVVEWIKANTPARVGFEADSVTYKLYHKWVSESPNSTTWVPFNDMVIKLRSFKTVEEMEAINKAQAITDRAGVELPLMIQVGKTEKQVGWELEKFMREQGADGLAFESIVASGSNAALPHHRPTDRVIQADEPVTIDFGAMVNGWHSDMTRNFFTGAPTEKYTEVYNTVLAAQEAVLSQLKAGIGEKAADKIARDLITDKGYGDYFGHGLGHGVGLAIHEQPLMSYRSEDDAILHAGQLVTVEPGIYISGWGGVRIEDMALILPDGIENLTHTSKDIDAWRKARG